MTKEFSGSAGGGGGGSFVQRPDTLRSNDVFEGVLGICAGPIKGLRKGLKSLKLNGTTVEDNAGALNFKDMVVVVNNGDPALHPQLITPALGSGGVPTSVGLTVANPDVTGSVPGDWVVKTVTNLNADFIDMRFVVQQLYHQDASGINEVTANLEIQMKPSALTTWINPNVTVPTSTYDFGLNRLSGSSGEYTYLPEEYFDGSGDWLPETNSGYLAITGKTTSAYVKELRIVVPNTGPYASTAWDVRVRLREPANIDADPVFTKRLIQWESIAGGYTSPMGVTEGWRGLATGRVYGKATDEFNGVPTLEGEYDTKIVSVPPSGVYNPDTRQYTGAFWDGSFNKAYTNDPAWVINDALSDSIFGMSSLAPGSHLNKWDALEASKWFSELVWDGDSGTHPRYSLNFRSQAPQKATEFIQYLAGAVGGFAWDNGNGEWRLKVDKPEAPSDIVTLETIEGEFAYSHTDFSTRYNEITVSFVNEELGYREDRVTVQDAVAIALHGRKPTTIVGIGCTNRQEAIRRGTLRLRSSQNEYRMVNYSTNRRGRLLTPFCTILIADADLGYLMPTGASASPDADIYNNRTTGRVVSTNGDRTQITLRDSVRLELGVTYVLHFAIPNPNYNPDATTEPSDGTWDQPTITVTRTIVNTSGQRGDVNTLYLGSALPIGMPEYLAVAIEAAGLPAIPKMFRVLSVKGDEQDPERCTISAIEVDTGKWAAADAATATAVVYQAPDSVVPSPLAPSAGTLLSTLRVRGSGPDIMHLVVNWQRPPSRFLAGFKVQYRLNGGPWIIAADNLQDTSLELVNPAEGTYDVEVSTRDRRGNYSAPLAGTIDVETVVGDYTNYRGLWLTLTDYVVGDIVYFDGTSYRCITNHTSATAPPDVEWEVFAAAGATFANVTIYRRSATPPTLPSVDATFTFSPPGITGLNNGWTSTIPAGTDPLYVAIGVAQNTTPTDVIAPAEWSTPSILAENGLKTATIYLYRRGSTSPTAPSGTFTYTFDTGVLSGGTLNSWTQTVPAADGNPLWVKQVSVGSTALTLSVTAASFSSAVIFTGAGNNQALVTLYQRSASLPSVPGTTLTYTFSTGLLTGTLGSWSQSAPTGTNPLYIIQFQAISPATTLGIASAAWPTPVILARDGADGMNTADVVLYRRSATSPTMPTGTFTYTFSTRALSGGTLNGWTQAYPTDDGTPLWITIAAAVSATTTDTIAAAEFAAATLSTGAGLNRAMVFLYQRAASAPSVPGTTLTYTFSTGALTGTLGSWSTGVPAGSNPLYVIQATALAVTDTDTIPTGEWSAPQIMAQDGATGPSGFSNSVVFLYQRGATAPAAPTGTFTYTFATGVLSGGTPGSWTQAVPAADGNPLWVIAATASANTATDTIAAAEFSSAVVDSGAGVNQTAIFLYQRGTSTPSVPAGTLVYTFSTGGLGGTLGSWTRTIPSGSNPVYVTQATALGTSSTDSIATGEWSAPVVLSQDGANNAVVYLYKRSATTPTGITTGNFDYTFSTGVIVPQGGSSLSGWTQAIPTADGNPLWVISSVASANVAVGVVTGASFTAVVQDSGAGVNQAGVKLYQRAASAPAVPGTTLTYTFSTGALTGTLGSWTTAIPAVDGNPLYVIEATAIGVGSTDSILTGDWNSPRIMAQDGAAGLHNAVVFLYQRGAAAPAAPTGTFTYTFATSVLSGGTPGSWTQAVPTADGNPLWIIVASASSNGATDTILAAEFSSPVIDSGAGVNQAAVTLYQRAASAPSVPGTTLTYTFSTGVLSGTLGSWTTTIPSGSNPLYVTQATAVSTSATDTIATGEWTTPGIIVQDGANNATVYLHKRGTSAPAAPTGTFTYTFATGALSGGTLNGWTQAVPAADGTPLWVIAATASASTATDTILAAEFTSAVMDSGAGLNNAVVTIYQRSATAPAVPGATLTYTFSTGVLSGTLGSWTTTMPVGTNALYASTATALSTNDTDTIPTGEWATPRVLTPGMDNSTVELDGNNILRVKDAGIVTNKVAANAITNLRFATGSATVVTNTTYVTLATLTFTPTELNGTIALINISSRFRLWGTANANSDPASGILAGMQFSLTSDVGVLWGPISGSNVTENGEYTSGDTILVRDCWNASGTLVVSSLSPGTAITITLQGRIFGMTAHTTSSISDCYCNLPQITVTELKR